MITASDRAVEKLKDELIKKFLDVGLGYRITGKTCEPGCTTLTMELDKEQPGDEVVVSHGIKILIDHRDAALLRDYELDYVDGPTSGFCLINNKVASGDSRVRGGKANVHQYSNQGSR